MSAYIPADPFYVPDKEPGFVYEWKNRADRNMVMMTNQGWEVVSGAPELPPGVRAKLSGLTGQSTEVPVTEEVRMRGDLVLMRIPEGVYEERVAAPERAHLARQQTSLDTLVEQANDQARSALARRQQSNIRARHVFQTTDDNKFDDVKT
jgi:hypothetical protein